MRHYYLYSVMKHNLKRRARHYGIALISGSTLGILIR